MPRVEGRREPPTSHRDSLGVIVAGVEMEGRGNFPTGHNDSLGVIVAGVAGGRERRALNKS